MNYILFTIIIIIIIIFYNYFRYETFVSYNPIKNLDSNVGYMCNNIKINKNIIDALCYDNTYNIIESELDYSNCNNGIGVNNKGYLGCIH
jgi:hypothetical protein